MLHSGMVLAAPQSGSGKTTISCALLAAMKKRGIAVRAFKSGPDYIDPMFHRQIIGVPSRNLDTFFSDADQIRELYNYDEERFTHSVIEGAMGLYDGLGGTKKEGSAYHLAQTLDLPVILILDARGMGRTMVALLAGMLQYDSQQRIAGVILNRTSEPFCRTMTPVIEKELGLPVLGCFPVQKDLHLESRHLGLKLPGEITDIRQQVEKAAGILEQYVDIDRLLQITESRALLHAFRGKNADGIPVVPQQKKNKETVRVSHPVIAVAKDAAFCFYYEDNLRMLKQAGTRLVYFSPLHDEAIPEEANALLLGGGYPELCAMELSENRSMRESIRAAIAAGMPSVAECGGFMYLHETLTDASGQTYLMAGVIHGNCHNNGKLTRFGYVSVREHVPQFLGGEEIRAHEFHYYDSDANGADCVAEKPVSGAAWQCIHTDGTHWWGYPHLYYPSNPAFVEKFVTLAREYQKKKGKAVTKRPIAGDSRQNRPGRLYGIGVGPGDPKLMTLQALEVIRSCDLIILPAVTKEECYAYRIVEQVCPEIASMPLLCMPFPMIKDAQKLELAHTRIYAAIEESLRQGQIVGMLTIGDPSVYSTYLYMHRRAQNAGWQAQIINGVPSFCAVAARLGIALGEKQQEIHIIPAAYDVADTFAFHGTCIYMKSGRKLEELIRVLQKYEETSGQKMKVYGVSNCGMDNEKVYHSLQELQEAAGYLTTVIVKK